MKALILVDLQNDFCPAGAFRLRTATKRSPEANRLRRGFDLVVATQIGIRREHGALRESSGPSAGRDRAPAGLAQLLCPCMRDRNARGRFPSLPIAPALPRGSRKGVGSQVDSYSGFFETSIGHDTGLDAYLREAGAKELYIAGWRPIIGEFTALDRSDSVGRLRLSATPARVELIPGDIETGDRRNANPGCRSSICEGGGSSSPVAPFSEPVGRSPGRLRHRAEWQLSYAPTTDGSRVMRERNAEGLLR